MNLSNQCCFEINIGRKVSKIELLVNISYTWCDLVRSNKKIRKKLQCKQVDCCSSNMSPNFAPSLSKTYNNSNLLRICYNCALIDAVLTVFLITVFSATFGMNRLRGITKTVLGKDSQWGLDSLIFFQLRIVRQLSKIWDHSSMSLLHCNRFIINLTKCWIQ